MSKSIRVAILVVALLFILPLLVLVPVSNYCASPIQSSGNQKYSESAEIKPPNHTAQESEADKSSPILKFLKALYSAQEAHYKADGAENKKHSWWHTFFCDLKITDFLIALFTYWLALVTAALVYMGVRQEAVLHKSVDAATKAAAAATAQADAAVKASMPVIVPLVRSTAGLLPREGAADFIPSIRIAMENHGKSPGVIVKMVYELWLGGVDAPLRPPWLDPERRDDAMVIPGDTRMVGITPTFDVSLRRPLTNEELVASVAIGGPSARRFFFYGYVIYDDIFGYQHIKGFGRKVFPPTAENPAPHAARGGPTFEYYHRIDRHDDSPC